MRVLLLFFVVFLTTMPFTTYSQKTIENGFYSDRITDEYGNPIARVKVSVQGKSTYAYSDSDGFFRIKANYGDLIVLSKNGERINSYRLDGSTEYRIEDESETVVPKAKSSRKYYSSTGRNQYYLDSAEYYAKKDPYKSIDFIELQLQNNKKLQKQDFVRSYTLLGNNYLFLKQYDLAVSNYQMALQKSTDINLKIKLAKALSKVKNYRESNAVYEQIRNKDLSHWQRIQLLEGLAINNLAQKQKDEALTHYKQALQIAKTHQITPKISALNAKIAAVLSTEGKQQEAAIYIQNTLENSKSEHLKKRASVQNKVAEIYQENNAYDQEIQLRKQTLSELKEAKIDRIPLESDDPAIEKSITTSQLNLDIGKAYLRKKEYKKAIPYLEKSAVKAKESEDLRTQKDAVQQLSELYKKIGNSKKALQKYQEYAQLVDQLYQQKEKEIQDAIALNNSLREKQNRINSLEKDRKLSENKLELSLRERQLTEANYKRQKLFIYALLIGLLLLGVALYTMYKNNEQRRFANNLLALKSLRSQMNPHFIFNALNSVNSFIAQSDERAANRYLTDFSTLMRNVLNNSEQDFIPLAKEIELLELYLKLEHSRFQDKFDYELIIDKNLPVTQFQIPPMLLQPYVENAVWHGLRYKKTKGKLHIKFEAIDSESIRISIVDDGIGRTKSKELKTQNQKKQQSKGMNNIKKRIQILNEMYQDKVTIHISDLYEDQTGTKVLLTIKKD